MAPKTGESSPARPAELPAHSARGPSAGDRWLYRPHPHVEGEMQGCPASVRLAEGAPDTETFFAAEGTAAHWISELCRINEVPAEHYLGHTDEKEMPHPDGGSIVCDQEMVDGVNYFLEYVNGFHGQAFYEIKVTYMQWVEKDGFGTADDIRIDEDLGICYVTDLKYGKGVQVFAKNSIQLMLYALGVYEVYGELYDFDKFQLNICQPRLDHIDEWEISLKDLLEWANVIVRPAAELTLEEDAPINPGEWCRWCPIKARCRKRATWVLSIAGEEELLSNEELALVQPHLGAIRAWTNEVEAAAQLEVARGGNVGGWYLSEGRSNRAWKDEKAVAKALRNYKFRVNDIYNKELISPTQFEKLAGKDHAILKKHVHKPQGKPKLTPPWSDKPRYAADPKTEFGDVDDSDFADMMGLDPEDDLLA